jgi:hypothetical protein
MSDVRRFALVDVILLALVLVVAGAARCWYLAACADGGQRSGPIAVQDQPPKLAATSTDMRGQRNPNELDALVHNLNQHNRFACLAPLAEQEEPTAHVAPGYPWLVAMAEKLTGDPPAADRWIRWLQAGLGTLTAGLYFLFARRAFRSQEVGVLAGLLCALYPFWICNTAEINDGTVATFLLAVVIFLGSRGGELGGAFTSLLYGLTLAGLSMVRATALPFAFVALLWYCYRSRSLHRGWLYALLAFLGFTNGLVPWTLRNVQTFGEVVPIADSTYLHLWEGNHAGATGRPLSEADLRRAATDTGMTVQELSSLPQPERYRRLAQSVVEEVRDRPAETIQRRIDAALYFFLGGDYFRERKVWRASGDGQDALPGFLENQQDVLLLGSLFGVLFLGAIGWRWTHGWRYSSMPASLAVLWLPLPYILSHAEALHGPRLPLDGVFLCYAAFTLVALVPVTGGALLLGDDSAARTE